MTEPDNSSLTQTPSGTERGHNILRKDKVTYWSQVKIWAFYKARGARSWFDRLAFRHRDRLSLSILVLSWVSTVLGLLGLLGVIQSPTVIRWLFFIWSLFVLALSSIRTFVDNVQREVDKINPEYARYVERLAKTAGFSETFLLCHDDANRDHGVLYKHFFPEYLNNDISIDPQPFEVPDVVEKYADSIIALEGAGILNRSKIRLATDIQDLDHSPRNPVVLQKTCYFHDRITNNLAQKRITSGGEVILGHRFMADGDGLVGLAYAAELSNQLGGSTILVTSDRRLVYVEQGSGALENPSRYASAGSGSFDWPKLISIRKSQPNLHFGDFARLELERELAEEVGFDRAVGHKTFLVGFGRYIYRNGKPEMFGLTVTKQASRDLGVRYQEWQFIRKDLHFFDVMCLDGESTRSALQGLLHKLKIESHGNSRMSVPLIMNICAATAFIDHEKQCGHDPIKAFYE